MRTIQTILILFAVLLITACSGSSGNPVELSNNTKITTQSENNRYAWGFWTLNLSEESQTVEVIPFRGADMHFNLVKILEDGCINCLTIENFQIVDQNNWIFDLKLTHPFPGLSRYTGFDVRGIFVIDANYEFPISGKRIAWSDDLPQILNADGYTTLFNPTEFPMTDPACLGYIQGKYSNTDELSATLCPFVSYNMDKERRMFETGSVVSQSIHLFKPVGSIKIGYAIDVSWAPSTNNPVTDPVNDFPPEANSLEAYRIEVDVEDIECSWFDIGDSVLIKVKVFDHQGADTITEVFVEAPDIFTGAVELDFHEITDNGGVLFKGNLTNEFAEVPDEYPLIVRVFDSELDSNLGSIQAWELYSISVGIETGWARTWGGLLLPNEEYESVRSIIDSNGNIYVGGHFEGTVDFDPGTESGEVDEHYSNGYSDNFLSKFDECGNFLWTFTFGGAGLDILSSVALNTDDKIYLTGYFQHAVDFDPSSGIEECIANIQDIFLVKYTSNGELQWVRTWGGDGSSSAEMGMGVRVDETGNVFVTGAFSGLCDFDPGPDIFEVESMYGTDAFLSKFDSEGNFQWVRTWGSDNYDHAYRLCLDNYGNPIVSGNMDGGTPFIRKYGFDGSFEWSHDLDNDITYYGLDTDNSGNVLVNGHFEGTVDFDPGSGSMQRTSNGDWDAFLTMLDSGGNFQWVRTWGSSDDDFSYTLVTNSEDIFVVGSFSESLDFDPGTDEELITSSGEQDAFLSKFDMYGNFIWVRTWGKESHDTCVTVSTSESGNIYVGGKFSNTVDFDPGLDEDWHIANGSTDVYLIKFLFDGNW